MFSEIELALSRLYPSRTWGEPDDVARFEAGISEEDGLALADELAAELRAATFYRPGEAEEYCDYIYVLCIGREPCLIQIRDGGVPLPEELWGEPVREQYLRVCLSLMAPMAGVQQVSMEMDEVDGDRVIRELPRDGVYDAPLLSRFQRLVAILPAYKLLHLDFGEISAPPEGFDSGDYPTLYGSEPHTANYLFFPQPSTMQTTSLLLG